MYVHILCSYEAFSYKHRLIKVREWINNRINCLVKVVISHPCPKFDGCLTKLSLQLGHGYVITSHCITLIYLLCPNPDTGSVKLC